MNLFGTFSFGNIIKTFIPGMLFILALALCIDDYNYWVSKSYLIFESASKNPALSIAMLIPLSIFMGIVSNSLCFTWVIPRFIEQPFKESESEFLDYKRKVMEEMRTHYMDLLQTPEDLKPMFEKHMDVRSFLLNKKDLSTLQYLRESYWYYMEFQVNSMLSVTILTIGAVANILLRYNAEVTPGALVFPYLVIILLSVYVLFKVFIAAARENYDKHEKKSLSFLQGAYHICRYGS